MKNITIEYLKSGGGKCHECGNGTRINRRIRISGTNRNSWIILCPQHYREFIEECECKLIEFKKLHGMFW